MRGPGAHRALLAAALIAAVWTPALAGPGEILIRLRAPDRPAAAARQAAPRRLCAPLESSRLLAEIGATLSPAGRGSIVAAAPLLMARAAPPVSGRAGVGEGPARAEDLALVADRLARTYVLSLAPAAAVPATMAALAGSPLIEFVAENRSFPVAPVERAGGDGAPRATAEAADPRRAEQWYLDRVGAAAAWGVTRGNAAVLVAVIDTGVLPHADLVPNLWRNDDPPGNATPGDDAFDQDGSGAVEEWERDDDDDNGYVDDESGYDFVDAPRIGGPGDAVGRDPDVSDDSGHGTAVAGVIAAVADNGIGIAGLAPQVTLMPVRAGFNPGLGAFAGVLEEDDAAAAIVYAAENGARILNLSFGDSLVSPLVADAVAYANGLGAVLVAAAGNSNADGMHYPSGLPGVIAAGASDYADERAGFSNYGPALDLLAPGEGILTLMRTEDGDDYVRLSGTSLAAPLVAAAAALLVAHAPDLGAAEIAAILGGAAHDLGAPGFDLDSGSGRLDAGRALTLPAAASVAILAPAGGAGVHREAPVVVTAEGLRLAEYTVQAGAGRDPAEFTVLAHAAGRQVVADTVATWITADLPAGEYTLQVRARDAIEGWREARTLVTVDHSAPVVAAASVVPLWVEDRLTPFVFFSTDDLARGTIEITAGAEERRIDEGFLTRDHVLRVPDDVPPGPIQLALAAVNSAGLAGAGPELPAEVPAVRARTDGLGDQATLADGELGPPILDLDHDGAGDLVVMGRPEAGGSPFGPLLVYESSGDDAWAAPAELPFRLLPRAIGDSDGDGRAEILASEAGTAWLLESRSADSFPDSLVWADTTAAAGFAVGFAALGDPRGPSLLAIRGDSLLVYRPSGDAAAWERTAYANFSGSNQNFAPTYFAGDLDGDGAPELVIGDAGGRLLTYRAAGGTLAPAGSMVLPAAANPRIAGGDVDGDGRAEVVVDLGVDLDISSEALLARRRHLLLVLSAGPGLDLVARAVIGVAGVEAGGNALRVASIDADPEAEILLVAAPDLYVFDHEGGDWTPAYYRPGVRSAGLAVGDGDGDGRAEVAVRVSGAAPGSGTIAVLEAVAAPPGPRPPAGLRARIEVAGAVELSWNPGGDRFRVYRAAGSAVDCGSAQFVAEVTAPAYRDTTAGGLDAVSYRVSAVLSGVEGGCSAPLTVRAGMQPVLLSAAPEQARAVRIVYSQAMDETATRLENYRLLDAGSQGVPLSSVLAGGGDRSFLLVLAQELAPGSTMRLEVAAVRSVGGAPLAGAGAVTFPVPDTVRRLAPLSLESAAGAAGAAALELRLSAPPEPGAGSDPGSYRLGGGLVARAARVAGAAVTLDLDPATALHPGVFRVVLAPGLRGAAGEVVVRGQGDAAEVVIGGELVLFPNPYHAGRAAADGVTLVGLAPEVLVSLVDATGREVWRQYARSDGTAYITVRGNPALASGVYLVRIEGPAGGKSGGKLAIVR